MTSIDSAGRAHRRRLRWRRGLGSALALVLLLPACGGDDGGGAESESTGAAGEGEVDPNGVLRVSWSLLEANLNFDPPTSTSSMQMPLEALFDSLLHRNEDGTYEPGLAASAEIVDSSTIELEMRPDVVFSDGTPVDAEAVKFNLERNAAGENLRGFRFEILGELDRVEVTGPLAATIHLKSPIAGAFFALLADQETYMVSPTAVDSGQDMSTDPVAAGPFLLESVEPEARIVMVKNPDYYDADKIKLAGLEFVHTAQTQSTVTALQAGQSDIGAVNDFSVAESLTDPIVHEKIPSNSILLLNIDKSDGPLADVRVRQALAYAVDREVISERIYGGEAEPAWSLRPAGDPYNNPDLEGVYERDPDKARDLLAEAGYPDGFEMGMFQSPGSAVPELLQAQFAEIGVDVTIQQSQNVLQDFYVEENQPTFPATNTRLGLDAYTILLLPDAFANVGNYEDPELTALLQQGMSLPEDSPEAAEVWQDLADIIVGDVLFLPMVFHVQGIAYNEDRVGGIVWHPDSYGNNWPVLTEVFVKQ